MIDDNRQTVVNKQTNQQSIYRVSSKRRSGSTTNTGRYFRVIVGAIASMVSLVTTIPSISLTVRTTRYLGLPYF